MHIHIHIHIHIQEEVIRFKIVNFKLFTLFDLDPLSWVILLSTPTISVGFLSEGKKIDNCGSELNHVNSFT